MARSVLEFAAERTGAIGRAEDAMRGGLTIVTYHRVLPDALAARHPMPQLVAPESVFREQVRMMAGRFELVTVREGLRRLRGGAAAGRARVAITFDDGFADNAVVAAPVLREFGAPAAFFIVSGLTGTDGELWFEVAARRWRAADKRERRRAIEAAGASGEPTTQAAFMAALKSLAPGARDEAIGTLKDPGPPMSERPLDRAMTVEQLRVLAAAGHEIGGHSVTHPILTTLGDEDLRREVAGCRADLERVLGAEVTTFCYPNGSYDARVLEATRAAGWAAACTTATGRNHGMGSVLELRRVDAAPNRVVDRRGYHDERAFRARLCLLREPAA
jgi:peptidoglycan/xylan/chitin deacetylase (PgdA/CDA1 family)